MDVLQVAGELRQAAKIPFGPFCETGGNLNADFISFDKSLGLCDWQIHCSFLADSPNGLVSRSVIADTQESKSMRPGWANLFRPLRLNHDIDSDPIRIRVTERNFAIRSLEWAANNHVP